MALSDSRVKKNNRLKKTEKPPVMDGWGVGVKRKGEKLLNFFLNWASELFPEY